MLSNCNAGEDSSKSLGLQEYQSVLKEINPEYSLEGLVLKLKLQYFGHLRQRADSLEKTLMLGKTEGKKRRGKQKRSIFNNSIINNTVFIDVMKNCVVSIQKN